jgi:hypothetical protein
MGYPGSEASVVSTKQPRKRLIKRRGPFISSLRRRPHDVRGAGTNRHP